MNFSSVLVANRGEIAVRVMRSAAALGYRTVAVYSDADAQAPHVRAADQAVRIGGAPARESYLDVDRLIGAAQRSGATAVHPGYGFLSENAEFAQACLDAGLVFIGPSPETIRAMGDKAAAKRLMADAGVPLLAGYQGVEQDDERLLAEASVIGFPLMVKAAAGGGGKGMRLVRDPAALPDSLAAARREALSAFGSDTLILERALLRPRHVEIQIMADTHGHAIALGERDCSVQRRHQKVIEESPCPVINDQIRRAMSEAAVTAAKTVDYVGAGTVEFLLDTDGTFAFLEMNTRLQVEHPVTELVTGLDLVAWQLRIAAGEPLTVEQEDVQLAGHAIEARLYAEDPGNGYLPVTGRVERWVPPGGDGVRVDAGIDTGACVTPHYDPMLAKIIAYGHDRDEARRRLINALERTTVLGLATNRSFLSRILRHGEFAHGDVTTALLDEADLAADPEPSSSELALASALLHRERGVAASQRSPGLSGWSTTGSLRATQRLSFRDRLVDVHVTQMRDELHIEVDGTTHVAVVGDAADGLSIDGANVSPDYWFDGADRILVRLAHLDLDVRDVLFAPPESAQSSGTGAIAAPMHGTVTARLVDVGAEVVAGQRLLVLEAMKMEQPLVADVSGTVTEIVDAGVQVALHDIVVRIDPATTEDVE
ncbi:biotin carboxylase N-terminal domain-containing protein [Mycobacterium sp. smrl_JER01]|uniref:acetyl/propionyl/methylcrotonyl-CoA carboxylase subunit alpha n=1 Tax=Mycobacterium sp. smrl_JER01 TaxID=3402633 RepID=UPI003AD548CC